MQWMNHWTTAETLWVTVFVLVYAWYGMRLRRAARALKQTTQAWIYKLILRSSVFALCIVSLLGPLLQGEQQEVAVENKDIFFCIDVSSSMDARDIAPSRIEKMKLELRHMIESLRGSRMGLIIFSSEAFIQCPLTYDVSALLLFVDALKTDLVARGGTNFGSAIRMAEKRLEQATEQNKTSTAQIIVLISDGEDFGTYTQKAIETIRNSETHIFTLGIGTEDGTYIPSPRGRRRDRSGKEIHTRLRRDILQSMGDQYFEINTQTNQRAPLIASLREVKASLELQSSPLLTEMNVYTYFLALALILCILDVFIPIKMFSI